MISEIRAYFKSRIQLCDSDYKEISDPFGDNELSMAGLDKKYKLYFSSLSPSVTGNAYVDTVEVSLELYRKSGVNVNNDFDSLYDLAIGIKNTVMEPMSVKNQTSFSDITPNSITPEPLPTNDRGFKMVLSFTIRKDFDYQGV